MDDVSHDILSFVVAVEPEAYLSLRNAMRPPEQHRTGPGQRRPITAEIEFDRHSKHIAVTALDRHRLPITIRVREGTQSHATISKLIVEALRERRKETARVLRTAQDGILTPEVDFLTSSAPILSDSDVRILRRDLDLYPSAELKSTRRAREIKPTAARFSLSVEIGIDDEPSLRIVRADRDERSESRALLDSGTEIVSPLTVDIDDSVVDLSAEIRVPASLLDQVHIFVHWGTYDDLGSPWRDEQVDLKRHRSTNILEVDHRLIVHTRGSYGATMYAVLDGDDAPLWLGALRTDDATFAITADDSIYRQLLESQAAEERRINELAVAGAATIDDLYDVDTRIACRSPFFGTGRAMTTVDLGEGRSVLDRIRAVAEQCNDRTRNYPPSVTAAGVGELVFVTPEGPHAAAGGLAQVISGLLPEMARTGMPATIITPMYDQSCGSRHRSARETVRHGVTIGGVTVRPELIGEVTVHVGPTFWADTRSMRRHPSAVPLKVYLAKHGRVRIFFLHNPATFDSLYRPVGPDEQLRRAIVLSRGSLEVIATKHFDCRPSLVISNDWMTALTPVFAAVDRRYRNDETIGAARTVHMIHNAGRDYHGRLPIHVQGEDLWSLLGIGGEHFFGVKDPHDDTLFNSTAAALRHVTGGIITVSQPYAQHLVHGNASDGLEHLFRDRADRVFGISNAVSRVQLDAYFTQLAGSTENRDPIADLMDRKQQVKVRVQQDFGLRIDPHAKLLCLVGRLAEQKGLSLLTNPVWPENRPSLETVLEHCPESQIVVAGPMTEKDQSAAEFVSLLHRLRSRFPGRVAVSDSYIAHAEALRVMFGADFFLMPSRFEPGGITQLEAQAAGTLVIGRDVGGISSTVENFDSRRGTGTGFLCRDYDPTGYRNTLLWALYETRDSMQLAGLLSRAVAARHDWSDRVPLYRAVFQRLSCDDQLFENLPLAESRKVLLAAARAITA